jgi:hypothetical protein
MWRGARTLCTVVCTVQTVYCEMGSVRLLDIQDNSHSQMVAEAVFTVRK